MRRIDEKEILRRTDLLSKIEPAQEYTDRAITRVRKALAEQERGFETNFWRKIMKSRLTKLAAAAVIMIVLAVPLGYGATKVIKAFFISTESIDEYEGEFKLDKDIYINLKVGTKEQPAIVQTWNIRFFVENGQLLGTLRSSLDSWPKLKWRVTVMLLDAKNETFVSAEQVRENCGVKHYGFVQNSQLDIHYSFGKWDGDAQSHVKKVRIRLERVTEGVEATKDAWVETDHLTSVYGRVTGPGGEPIANAVVAIREKRKPGQGGIAAPDIYTDADGFYSFDRIAWPYQVSVVIGADEASDKGWCWQSKKLNEYFEGTENIDFTFDKFPAGDSGMAGTATTLGGGVANKFTVSIRNKGDFKEPSGDYSYGFGVRKDFVTTDGNFEIRGLPAGVYTVSLIGEELGAGPFGRQYTVELRAGEEIRLEDAKPLETSLYGRVVFEDGSPASLDGTKTLIVQWTKGFPEGMTVATVDANGFFVVNLPEEEIARLRSGQEWLTVNIAKKDQVFHKVGGTVFSAELLSPEREAAGALEMPRPLRFFGRIQYEDGRPAYPNPLPWDAAKVFLQLRCTPATSSHRGLTIPLGDVDNQGRFEIILTPEELGKVRAGEYLIQIYHPSYADERSSFPAGDYPAEMLGEDPNAAQAYKLQYRNLSRGSGNVQAIFQSCDRIKKFHALLKKYCIAHGGAFPTNIEALRSAGDAELLMWASQNVEYGGQGRYAHEPDVFPLAYDKILPAQAGGTTVLFSDGHIEFRRHVGLADE